MGNFLKDNDFIENLLFTIPLKMIIIYIFFSPPSWKWDISVLYFLTISGYLIFSSLKLIKKQKIIIICYIC